jgi:omega-hydroxy-beta-dihydromenaquinone-9 sulfotransferase
MTQPTEWTPRVWQGCTLPAFLRLLWTNRFAIAPRFAYMPLVMTTVSALTSALQVVQDSWYGSKLDRTPIREPPLFILGHWRTGTTLLHELLALDPRFTYPNTYHCFAPHHFLLTEPFADACLRWMLPSRRPMDNMAVGWSRPQEDEFAMCLLGQPSPYLTIAFPNRPPQPVETLDLDGLPRRQREAWKRAFVGFLKHVTYRDPRRLLLKSPTHSCRIPTLLELFPDAQFLHVVRNPYAVFASTVKLWQSLYLTHGLQVPTFAGLEEYVFDTFSHLYNRLQETRSLVPAGNFLEVRYEDLIAAPAEVMRRVYDGLRLGEFDEARPRLEAFWQQQAGYQTNRFPPLAPALQAEIARRWGAVIERYGYSPPTE